ncbi:MAG: phosphotransferase [Myxococcales bacterium]|nr:phosphotransferase [Myxococcales bacterium]
MEALRELVLRLFPSATIEGIRVLGADEAPSDATRKGAGYGVPVRVSLRDASGMARALVFHTARADDFGHDRRSDRAQEMLLAFDTFGRVPRHVPALDVGVIGADGALRSIADAGELYLLTGWAEGELYAADLRRIVRDGATDRDRARVDVLAGYLAGLHAERGGRPAVYRRAVRDLVGAGEGIFGMIDGYPDDVPAAPPARLRAIEERCLAWRWQLRGREHRLTRTHGDFHPFNLVFDDHDQLALLDASRGCAGDPADDLTALAVNYVFFALDAPGAWRRGLGDLWHRLWTGWLDATGDREVLEVAAPWLAWRALVVANPRWYPGLSAGGRDGLLRWIERVLDAPRLELASADEVAS